LILEGDCGFSTENYLQYIEQEEEEEQDDEEEVDDNFDWAKHDKEFLERLAAKEAQSSDQKKV
jgi:hypothetical protein